jgi:hypothetical protein
MPKDDHAARVQPINNRQQTLAAALELADVGLRVIPIAPGRKHPATHGWPDIATSNPTIIRQWWNGTYRRHGVGVATGTGSRIWVLDVDVANGKPGGETLAALETIHGTLPSTVEAITGTGGRHLYFAWSSDHPVRNDQSGRVGAGLDVRGEGGLVVAPPTRHPGTSRPYTWRPGHAPDQHPIAPAPAWLHDLLDRDPGPPAPAIAVAQTRTRQEAMVRYDDSPAATFNAATTWVALLTRDGWTLTRELPSGEQRWTRPGKTPRDGTSATVGHAGRDVLKVFTSSIPGLDADRAYSRFGYQAAVHHHGDRSALASAVRRAMNRGAIIGDGGGVARSRLSTFAAANDARRPSAVSWHEGLAAIADVARF